MWGRPKVRPLRDKVENKTEAKVEAILDDIIDDGYAADIAPLIKFITETPVEFADDSDYGTTGGRRFHSGYGYTAFLTLVFADKAVTFSTHHSGMGRSSDILKYSSIKVFRKEFSPQLDLFREVEPFELVGSINSDDVPPAQRNELFRFMGEVVKAAKLERKKQEINDVLRIFE